MRDYLEINQNISVVKMGNEESVLPDVDPPSPMKVYEASILE
jgi:hypothetical protein